MSAESFTDLEQVIADSVNDAQLDTSSDEPAIESDVEAAPVDETPVESTTSEEAEPVTEEATSSEVPSPAAQQTEEEAQPQDEFEKLAGMPQMGVAGRENRIPYSRVKKITEKAVSELAEAALGRKLGQGEKALDVVKAHVAQIPELTSKVSEYEKRLDTVGEFENVMANDPQRFLTMLAKVPAYNEFFQFVNHAYETFSKQQSAGQTEQATAVADAGAGMPEPDEELADGSKVYSIQGLQNVLDWKAKQIEARIGKQFEDRNAALQKQYEPMEKEWRERRRLEAARPVVQKQLEEAAKWPLFKENEEGIAVYLEKNPRANLETAYREVVFPKLLAERSQIKQGVIKEMQTAPTSTSMPSRAATKPNPPKQGPRNLEDVIRSEVEKLK